MIYSEYVLICIASPILLTLLFVKGSARRYALFFVIGMVVCLLSAYVGGFVQQVSGMDSDWVSIYASPVTEELMKMIPLVITLLLSAEKDAGLLPSGIALAAGFATFENCCYILSSGADVLVFILIRGLSVGIMHIVSVLILYLGLIMAERMYSRSLAGIIGALSLSMTFHSLYNLLVSEPGTPSIIGYIMPALTALILYEPYRRLVPGLSENYTETC
ncbi:MAG: PrsW family intramembrane metalloprotease [Clostridiales bacterium]|nr:PrsW family intramembrane metalloprotease [Clostridiales bacterium]